MSAPPRTEGGLLNHSLRVVHIRHRSNQAINGRECSKKSVQQGRRRVDARSVRFVRERERREERHVCEPEGRQHGENAARLSACGTHRQAAFFNIPEGKSRFCRVVAFLEKSVARLSL